MLLEFGRANLIEKALQQPERVRETLQKVKTDGLVATVNAVRSKLDQPIPLGYCNAGVVKEVGNGVVHVKTGDRVVSNAPHAEFAVVGKNLTAKIPEGVSDDEAAFTPLAAIALQGCRLATPSLGETFCVMGLGLIGLLAVQLLRSHGCRVIGVDFSAERLELARQWGAETIDLSTGADPIRSAMAATHGVGVDGVLIAAATKSDDVVSQAAQMCRKRGRIVLVGVVGLQLSRSEFYQKELTFQVSCSYGPGRYDPDYEARGEDYPIGFVRWTEQRNFEAVLNEMDKGRLVVGPLISDRVAISDATSAYERLARKGGELGILLAYPRVEGGSPDHVTKLGSAVTGRPEGSVVGLIGAGGFGGRITAPALRAGGARLKTVVSRGGVSSVIEGRKSGFEQAATDPRVVFDDQEINTVVIATRHDSHAELACQAIEAGKAVFVEKPLALSHAELSQVEATVHGRVLRGEAVRLMVGFNRRFAPLALKMKLLADTVNEPKCISALINAGSIPIDHWTQDPEQGGGRIIGEACHFIDLMRFFVGEPITSLVATPVGRPTADGTASDKVTLTMTFGDGSIATVHYFANGPKALAKERYELLAAGKYLRLDNFKSLSGLGWNAKLPIRTTQDKGHAQALAAFVGAVSDGGPIPIPIDEVLEVSRWSIDAALQVG